MPLEDEGMREVGQSPLDAAIKAAYTPSGAPVQDAAAQQQPAQTVTQHLGAIPTDQAQQAAAPAQPAQPAQQAAAPLVQDQNPKLVNQPGQASTEADFFSFKSNGKYDSWEKIMADIDKPAVEKVVEVEKRVLVAEPLKFNSDTAKAIYEALAEEKYELVLPFLEQRSFVAKLDTMPDEQVIKAELKIKYPSLDPDEINAEFDAVYKPDENVLSTAEFSRATKKAQDKLSRDAKLAKDELRKISEKLELPKPAAAQQPQAPVLSDEAKSIVQLGKSYVKGFDAFSFEYESPDKTRAVKGEYKLPETEVAELEAKIQKNPQAFLAGWFDRYSQANGDLNAKAIAKDVILFDKLSKGEFGNSLARAASEQTFEAVLRKDRNYVPDAQRQAGSPMPGKEEADRAAMLAFAGVPVKK